MPFSSVVLRVETMKRLTEPVAGAAVTRVLIVEMVARRVRRWSFILESALVEWGFGDV